MTTPSSVGPVDTGTPQAAAEEGGSEGQQQPHACRWRFCTAVLPSADALRAHVVAHVDEAHPAGPGPSPGAGARGAATDGVERERERPEPHGEKSFPVLKEGAVLQPPAGHDGA
ncbi:hypothetical protein JCM3770_006888 [Rhodotorula araucariae]